MKLWLAAVCAAIAAGRPALAAPPPAAAFGRLPIVQEVRISPDGRRLAIANFQAGKGSVGIAAIDGKDLVAARLGEVEVNKLQWLTDDYLLAEVTYPEKLGVRTVEIQRVVVIWAADGHVASTLLGNDVASANLIRQGIAGVSRGPPPRVWMVGEAGRIGQQLTTRELFKVDPATGLGEPIEKGDRRTINWGFDSEGNIGIRLDQDEHGELVVLTRTDPGAPWTVFWTSHGEEERRGYQGEAAADHGIYISHYSPQGRQLVLKQFSDGSETPVGPPHLEEPVRMVWDPYNIRLSGRGFGSGAISYEWYDPELAEIHSAISRALPGKDAQLLDWSKDRNRFIVWVDDPDTPLIWYLFDRKQRSLSPLAEEYPELNGAKLGRTRWIAYKARDGLTIAAYLTLPPGADTAKRLPLIVLPHDGPAARSRPNFSYLTQFLATRGYAVLRPQFRGSTGFGKALEDAGDRQWGTGMQTDLLDGIAELSRQGLVDANRVCIVGEGFGGYAALAGASLHPEAYSCAASLSGVSNLKVLLANSGTAFRGWAASLRKIPYRDPLYDGMSPSQHAAAVQAPILLATVDHDSVAPTQQTELMREALQAAHKPFEELVLKNADHNLTSDAARTLWLQTLESFLTKNLPVR
jgi:dienelactone hydrolase